MANTNNKTILLVQNQIEQVRLWKSGLFAQNCQVITTVAQAESVAKIITDCPIDLLLLDLNIGTFNPYIFSRNILKKNSHLQVVLTDHKRKKISELEWQWTKKQGAKDIILGLEQPNQLTYILRRLFQILAWQNLYNEAAFENPSTRKQLQQPRINSPSIDPVNFAPVFIRNLCHQMYSSEELVIKNRRWHLRIFHKCFIGEEGVNWLCKHLTISRTQAVQFGQKLLEQGYIFHVLNEHDFKDGYFFYRFSMDGFPSQRLW